MDLDWLYIWSLFYSGNLIFSRPYIILTNIVFYKLSEHLKAGSVFRFEWNKDFNINLRIKSKLSYKFISSIAGEFLPIYGCILF